MTRTLAVAETPLIAICDCRLAVALAQLYTQAGTTPFESNAISKCRVSEIIMCGDQDYSRQWKLLFGNFEASEMVALQLGIHRVFNTAQNQPPGALAYKKTTKLKIVSLPLAARMPIQVNLYAF